jgi:hypothetical protein
VLGFVTATDNVRDVRSDAPLKELFDFVRLDELAPGASRTVQLSVPPAVLSLTDVRGIETLRGGDYAVEVGVGGAAEGFAVAKAGLRVVGEEQVLFSLPSAVDAAARAGRDMYVRRRDMTHLHQK